MKNKHKHNSPKRNNGLYLSSNKPPSRPRVGNENAHQDIQVSNQDSSKNNLLSSPYQVNAPWTSIETINCPNKHISNLREISITTISMYPQAPITNQSMPTPNAR